MASIATDYNKSNVLELIAKNEPIGYHYINMFLAECYSSNDIESVKKLFESAHFANIFMFEDTYYSHTYEIHNIMKKIALFNNIDIIDIIMHYANDYVDNYKQQDAGCYIASILYKYNFDITAEELINNYYLDKGEIILNMYKNGCDIDKMKYIISKYPDSIQAPNRREWMLAYSGRYDDIEMIKFLKQYYEYTTDDIFKILFNFSKSNTGSMKLYIYIFNNYIDIIKNETLDFIKLIKYIFDEEHYDLIYFILSKIQFNEQELVEIFTCIFSYTYFFEEIINNITNIMLNTWEMKPIELRNIYCQINNNNNIHSYIEKYF
jgi:hypothetical protein